MKITATFEVTMVCALGDAGSAKRGNCLNSFYLSIYLPVIMLFNSFSKLISVVSYFTYNTFLISVS